MSAGRDPRPAPLLLKDPEITDDMVHPVPGTVLKIPGTPDHCSVITDNQAKLFAVVILDKDVPVLCGNGFGLFAGTAVNDTSSVTAAASAWDGIHGSNTLEIATIVKLTRTLAIIPITLVLALWRTHKAKTEQSRGGEAFSLKRAFPMFILYFVLASIITTVCTTVGVPAGVFTPLKTLSKFFIVMAMAAIGMNTNIVKLVKTGGKPIFMGFCCWVAIACVSIAMQHLLGFL